MRHTAVAPSSRQDNAVQKPNASIRSHCREVTLQPNRGHEHLCLTTIRKFYFGKEDAMSACNVDKSDWRTPSGIYHATLRRAHCNVCHNITA